MIKYFEQKKKKIKQLLIKQLSVIKRDQPVLIGTTSINKSEIYSGLLNNKGIKHSCLNAKHHEKKPI